MNVSIIIPALNEADYIASAIRSALAAAPLEVIVVDGGSTDQTVSIAKEFSCRVLQCQNGRAAQQNYGAQHAQGKVFLFLHADSRLAPACIRQIHDVIVNDRVSGGGFGHRIEADGRLFRMIEWGNALRVRWLGIPYGDQGIFVRREVFQELGGFPDVPLMEDVLLMRKVRRLGRVVLLPGPLLTSARRWQKFGPVRQTIRNWVLLSALRFGVSPNRLAHFYPAHES